MHLIAPTSIQINNEALNRCRVISNIFAGVSAGILGHGAGLGVLWWIGLNAIVGLLIYLKIVALGFDANGESKFFQNPLSTATSGLFGNLMTYLLFWIMFFNIVYVI